MYDTVQVLVDAVLRMLRKRPDFIRTTNRRVENGSYMDCHTKGQVVFFEFGERISRIIKRVS